MPNLFLTRVSALAAIEKKYGYIRTREYLRIEPHGWHMPIPVKVKINLVRLNGGDR